MHSINKYFDKVYWINTPRRHDRRTTMLKRLLESGIDAERSVAIDGDLLRYMMTPENRENHRFYVACLLSHLHVLNTAYESGYEHILILEDDVRIHKDSDQMFSTFLETPIIKNNDWDMLYFGYIPVSHDNTKWDYSLIIHEGIPDSPGILNANSHYTGAYAYAVNRKMMKYLLDNLSDYDNNIWGVDEWMRQNHLDKNTDYKVYGLIPQIFAHDNGISTTNGLIEDRMTRSACSYFTKQEDYI